MNSLVSGVVLEGLSTAGKTSVLREIKRVQAKDENAERSVVILGEHYSQQLQVIHGKEVSLSVSSHAELLIERISGVVVIEVRVFYPVSALVKLPLNGWCFRNK